MPPTLDRPPARRPIALALRIAYVRLRFPAILAVAFLVVGRWDAMRDGLDRLMKMAPRQGQGAVSEDTEYFCPMDPGVLGDWPDKCPICNMTLVRRRKGDAAPLPEGVVARMQASPYRIQLAGIRTATVEYRPLAREVEAVGTLEGQAPTFQFVAVVAEADAALIPTGTAAEVACDALPGRGPFPGKVVELKPNDLGLWASFEVEDRGGALIAGLSATARMRVPMDRVEPFRSMPSDPPPIRAEEPRIAYVCPDHAEVVRDQPGRCPHDRNELERRPLAANDRLRWWCPMHPEVVADAAGAHCEKCEGMKLVPRVVAFSPKGRVLAVPEGAIVDTGSKTIAYVERMPGMFDGVEVVVGPRCGDDYPVVRGLEPGQKVAAAGAFLIDAETKLNPAAGAAYFGGKKD